MKRRNAISMTVILSAFLIFTVAGAAGAPRTVTKTADTNDGVCDVDCSLREAISVATSGDTIVFSSLFNSAQTIALAGFVLSINTDLSIIGPGAELLTISGGNVAFVGVFDVLNGTVNLTGMTIRNAGTYGIHNFSNLTVDSSNITDNGLTGINNAGELAVNNSTISLNRSMGIQNTGDAVVTNSTISNNTGSTAGGVHNQSDLTLHNCTVSINVSTNGLVSGAGGIYNTGSGTLTIINSTISGNSKSGSNVGGGITHGGGSATITNSTVTNNTTVGANNAGGIFVSAGVVTVGNTIIAANLNNITTPDVGIGSCPFGGCGTLVSNGFNLVGNVGAVTAFNFLGDQKGTAGGLLDPLLDPLGDYGGPTQTHRLRTYPVVSSAIDRGNRFGANIDQRGYARPVDYSTFSPVTGGDDSDIGAYEVSGPIAIKGGAFTSFGEGVFRVRVELIGMNGEVHQTLTNRNGRYHFDDVRKGERYTLILTHGTHRFAPRIVTITKTVNNMDFVAR